MSAADPLVVALEEVASTAAHRGYTDVYRFAMSAAGHLLTDAVRHRSMAETVLDVCRTELARKATR